MLAVLHVANEPHSKEDTLSECALVVVATIIQFIFMFDPFEPLNIWLPHFIFPKYILQRTLRISTVCRLRVHHHNSGSIFSLQCFFFSTNAPNITLFHLSLFRLPFHFKHALFSALHHHHDAEQYLNFSW